MRARPDSLERALTILDAERPRILAGGTDYYPSLRDRPVTGPVLDISRIAALRGVGRAEGGGWRIGACASWTDLLRAELPAAFDGLKAAAREIGSVQIQNTATLAGNLCNASPAADGAPCLLALDAEVRLATLRGERALPLAEFLLGPRRTALAADEMMTEIVIPAQPDAAESAFVKLGARVYLVISIAMVSAVLAVDGAGRIAHARVALGACSAVAQRLPALEAALIGRSRAQASAAVAPEHFAPLSPIDDVRATAAYRREAAVEITRRALAPRLLEDAA